MKPFTKEELDKILELHGKWLRNEEGGIRADLSDAYLSGANLSDANLYNANLSYANLFGANLFHANLFGVDLRGANIDFTCWPLSCGSLGVKGDEQLAAQLLYHALDFAKNSGIDLREKDVYEFANESHVVTKHGKEKL